MWVCERTQRLYWGSPTASPLQDHTRCAMGNGKRPMTPLDWVLSTLPILLILLIVLALVMT